MDRLFNAPLNGVPRETRWEEGLSFLKRERRKVCICDNSHPHNAFVKFKCVSKNADQEKITVHAFEAQTIGVQFILCLRLSGTYPHAPAPQICAYEGKSDRHREREEEENHAERKRKKPLLSALLPARSSFIT